MDTGTDRMIAYVEDGVGWIVYNNPEKHNAMTTDMLAAMPGICGAFGADPDVRAVVIRGAGERAFISGADIAQLDSGDIPRPAPTQAKMADNAGTPGLAGLLKPVIAMVHGYCLGGGVMVAMTADIRICADDAQFGIPAAKLGVGYPYDAIVQLVALVGPGHAAEIMFSGRRVDAHEAARIGLVNRVVPKADLEPTVRALAAEIAANAPLSHVAHKLSIRAAARGGEPAERPAIDAAIGTAWRSEDCVEGRRSFLERRPSRFQGR
ncbi:MAG TPA: enoyl-CoA hydratase-related protein [Acidimicrobiales bacterium]|jgi:enoyl-CoA hydratase/carnithine racemase|nr:enoyl-CoA hydratase-related protein [Acidimicrobiales bacterium]